MSQLEFESDGNIDTRLNNLTKTAIALIKDFEQIALSFNENGYYVAFSGGKDSVVIYVLIELLKGQSELTFISDINAEEFIKEQKELYKVK